MDHFKKIAGYSSEKKSLKELGLLFRQYEKLMGIGVRLPRGVLISGEPGVGKTIMAEALIADSGVHCIKISASEMTDEDMLSSYLDRKFDEAASVAPAIVFLDELDKLVGGADKYGFEWTVAILQRKNSTFSNKIHGI